MNVLHALGIATEREKGAHDFYSQAAEVTHDTRGKEMFVWLAQQELGHFNGLRKLNEALLESGSEIELGHLSAEDSKVIESMPKSEVSGKVAATTTAIEALRLSMQAERASIELYRRMERSSIDPGAKMMFDELVAEEQAHLLLLEACQFDSNIKLFGCPPTRRLRGRKSIALCLDPLVSSSLSKSSVGLRIART